MEFQKFPKIPRLYRPVLVTEKLDGTNAQVMIVEKCNGREDQSIMQYLVADVGEYRVYAASRTRFITPLDDNFGFAKWVYDNAEQLTELGPGRHYGEWWGQGIQRGYDLDHKRFSLFNTGRWAEDAPLLAPGDKHQCPPVCCYVVPVLACGLVYKAVPEALDMLYWNGSYACRGYPRPEGVVVYHYPGMVTKVTFDGDGRKGPR